MIGDKITICGPEVLFETCVAMKFVDDDNDDDSAVSVAVRQNTNRRTLPLTVVQNTCTWAHAVEIHGLKCLVKASSLKWEMWEVLLFFCDIVCLLLWVGLVGTVAKCLTEKRIWETKSNLYRLSDVNWLMLLLFVLIIAYYVLIL